MVNRNSSMRLPASDYGVSLFHAFGRVGLGIIILIGLLAIIDIFVYLSYAGYTYGRESVEKFEAGYEQSYQESYQSAYAESYQAALSEGAARTTGGIASQGVSSVAGITALRLPTFEELTAFLVADDTDEIEYCEGVFTCFDFTAHLNNVAEAHGFRAAYVSIRARTWAHAVVAFETSDRGVVYIEPQSDRVIELEIGETYPWWLAGASKPSSGDSPVEEIRIIW